MSSWWFAAVAHRLLAGTMWPPTGRRHVPCSRRLRLMPATVPAPTALPSRRALLCSGALHGVLLAMLGVFGIAAGGTRPHAMVQVQEARAVPPPVAPAAPEVMVRREPVADEQPVLEIEVVEAQIDAEVRPIEPDAAPLPRAVEPTLDRVVHRPAVEPPVASLPVPSPPVPSPTVAAPALPEQSVRVPAAPRHDNQPPRYPPEARRRRQQGEVVLAVSVDEVGDVLCLEVAVTSGHELLDRAAVRAVSGWRFEPARIDGTAVATETRVAVEFRLER